MGTPDLEAYVAACLLRSCGLSSIPANFAAFLTMTLAAALGDRKDLVLRLDRLVFILRPQPVNHLSRNEHYLSILAALWVLDGKLLVI
jgi:hypothetical protein